MNILGRTQTFGERTAISGANLPPTTEEAPPEVVTPVKISVNPSFDIAQVTLPGSDKKKIRVMLCGTYPIGQSNGYSRVVYYIAKHLGLKEDIQLTIYGFQNFRQSTTHRNDIPPSVILHDALATENPRRSGFGDKEIADYLKKNPQDIVIIFNDMVVTSSLVKDMVEKLTPQERSAFKLFSYMDQVYPHQRPEFIHMLNTQFDGVITFTPYWEKVVRKLGLKQEIPTYFFPHGFDSTLYYPIPKKIARLFYDVPQEAFIVLNLNRNQPRKRWDHTLMAFVEVIERHQNLIKQSNGKKIKPIRLMVGTIMNGFWDLMEVFESELKRRGIDLEVGKEYLCTIARAQQQSDREINIMYNCCDIGLNTCEGEGFGLCQFEHLAVGSPQIAANIGGFKEFLHKDNSILVEPKWFYYVDKVRDGIGGYAEVSDPKDVADAIWKYYMTPKLVMQHGYTGRKEILQHYSWDDMVNILHRVIRKEVGKVLE